VVKHRRVYLVIGSYCCLMLALSACGDDQLGFLSPALQIPAPDGSSPSAGLIQGRDGNFYGVTANGGQFNNGTVFSITPDGVETVLYSFAGGTADGANPTGDLVQGSDGNFYGATGGGGPGECPGIEPIGYKGPPSACGTLFKLTPDGMETVLHFFSGGADGGQPTGSLVQGSDGNFYGTTPFGGGSRDGTVFRITLSGQETVLYSFPGGTANGANPYTALIQGDDGSFYGATQAGGNENSNPCGGGCGSLFKITPAGSETALYLFAASTMDGALPAGRLVRGSDGNFYGTTSQGGQFDGGTVFQITPAGVLTVLHSLRAPKIISNATSALFNRVRALAGKGPRRRM
jgi:uncharacterized repeat protein (TIGR03803 family)